MKYLNYTGLPITFPINKMTRRLRTVHLVMQGVALCDDMGNDLKDRIPEPETGTAIIVPDMYYSIRKLERSDLITFKMLMEQLYPTLIQHKS